MTPLADPTAEEAVVAACLIGGVPTVLRVQRLLPDTAAFTVPPCRLLYAAFLALAVAQTKIDHITIQDELTRAGTLEQVGGLNYLADLISVVATEANAEVHATIVRDFATRRALEAEGQRAIQAAHDLTLRAGDAIAQTVDRIVAASPLAPAKEATIASGLIEVMRDLELQAKMGTNLIGLASGLSDLDALTHGWQPGQVIIVAARPSLGKTAFGLHCAREAVLEDVPVYLCTQEMPRKQLLRRLIATETRQDLWRITSTERLDMSLPDLLRAEKQIAAWPLVIDERSATPASIRLAIQRMQAERQQQVGLVVVDYLGKLHAGVKTERHDLAIGHITGSLCRVALDFGVPVLLLCQLNRRSEQDGRRRRPTLSDLRDSGNIEQDADVVVALHRDEDASEWGTASRTEAVLLKNRNGETGVRNLHFDKATGRWTNWTDAAAPTERRRHDAA